MRREALSSGGQKLKIDTSTQIHSTPTLTALNIGKFQASAAAVIFVTRYFLLKFLMVLTISHAVAQNI